MKRTLLLYSLIISIALLLSFCKMPPHYKTPEEEITERNEKKSYHANTANRIVDKNEKNYDTRRKKADKRRVKSQNEQQKLNETKTSSGKKAIPFTFY